MTAQTYFESALWAYQKATEKELEFRAAADNAAVLRATLISNIHRGGMSYGQIAAATGLSRSRIQQLVNRGSKADETQYRQWVEGAES
jgi:transposase